jgi:uncharacterized protein (TIRG00374 family)
VKWSARWLTRLIGPGILIFFLLTTDLARIAGNLSAVHWGPLVISLLLYPLVVLPKAWRWSLLIRSLGMDPPPLAGTIRLYMIGMFLGGATPGQAGDFLKAWHLRDRGQPLGPALFSIMLDRLFDLMSMAVASLVGLVVLLRFLPSERRTLIEAAVVIAAITVAVLIPVLTARRSREWLMRAAAAAAPTGLATRLDRWRTQLASLELRPGATAAVLLSTVGAAVISIVRLWLLFSALMIQIPLLAVVSAAGLISVLQILPISFAGLGVRDAVLVAVLSAYGYRADQALALSALFLLLNLENILLGFLVSLGAPSSAIAPAGVAPDTRARAAP